MSMPDHQCPFPDCTRMVDHYFWGCARHWKLLPLDLQAEFRVTWKNHVAVQSVAHQMAQERIRNWIRANAEALNVPALARVASTDSRELDTGFAAGITVDSELLLFWPRSREFLVLSRDESRVVLRAASLLA